MLKHIKAIATGLVVSCWCFFPLLGDVPVTEADFTGFRTSSSGEITATGPWNGDFMFSWQITNVADISPTHPWQYFYIITRETDDPPFGLARELSHLIIQVSDGLTREDFRFRSFNEANVDGPDLFEPGMSNPGMPADIFGIKLDNINDDTLIFGFRSNRAPVWGDFYAKDGVYGSNGDQMDVYAYNAGFGQAVPPEGHTDVRDPFGYWIARPDSVPIPEPATILLLTSSLTAAGLAKLKKKKSS